MLADSQTSPILFFKYTNNYFLAKVYHLISILHEIYIIFSFVSFLFFHIYHNDMKRFFIQILILNQMVYPNFIFFITDEHLFFNKITKLLLINDW